ncbi:MAG: hypothetical protein GX421_03990 [Caldisericales bacterium]|nr:hypothetical protein [Caldisericales bacterium]
MKKIDDRELTGLLRELHQEPPPAFAFDVMQKVRLHQPGRTKLFWTLGIGIGMAAVATLAIAFSVPFGGQPQNSLEIAQNAPMFDNQRGFAAKSAPPPAPQDQGGAAGTAMMASYGNDGPCDDAQQYQEGFTIIRIRYQDPYAMALSLKSHLDMYSPTEFTDNGLPSLALIVNGEDIVPVFKAIVTASQGKALYQIARLQDTPPNGRTRVLISLSN